MKRLVFFGETSRRWQQQLSTTSTAVIMSLEFAIRVFPLETCSIRLKEDVKIYKF